MPTKKSVRSASPKKRVVRRRARSAMAGVPLVMAAMDPSTTIQDPMPTPEPSMPGPETGDKDCGSCGHMPMQPGAIVGLMAAVVLVLSMVVLASSMIISSQTFQIEVYKAGGVQMDNVARR